MFRRNVLIFHAGALGDFVLSWPLAVALGRLHPQSRIIYVSPASKGELAQRVLRLDAQDIEAGWSALHADPANLPARQMKTLVETHSVYTFIAKSGDAWLDHVAKLAPGAPIATLSVRPSSEFDKPYSEFLIEQLPGALAVQTAIRQILASIASKGLGTLRAAPSQGPIVLHPGSGSRDKCWPLARYVELAQALCEAKRPVKILLGPVEAERFAKSEIASLSAIAPCAMPPTYLDLLNELSAAAAFVGNDSGPGHLASIIGVPSVILYKATNPVVWKPLGPRVTTLSQASINAHDVARCVLDA